MQFNSVYLYPNKIDVFTNALASWQTERYRRVYNRNLKVFRGVDNRIDLQVRNSDQKSADITGSVLVFNIVARETKDLVIKKDCITVAASTGKVYVTFTEADLLALENGFYNYSVIQEVREAIPDTDTYRVVTRTPMFVDSQYGAVATLEISGDISGDVQSSIVVTEFSYTDPVAYGYTTPPSFISSIISGSPNLSTPQSLHTFAFYCTDYRGKITIQGSMSNSSTPENELTSWYDIPDSAMSPGGNNFDPAGATVTYRNVVGKWNWFRVKQIAKQGSSAQFTIQQTSGGSYVVNLDQAGENYKVSERVYISGADLGGVDGVNDLNITVTNIAGNGEITGFTWTGASIVGYKTFVKLGFKSPTDRGTLDKILYR
jgi:hypothetical protein